MRSHVREHDLAWLQGRQHPIDDLLYRLPAGRPLPAQGVDRPTHPDVPQVVDDAEDAAVDVAEREAEGGTVG
jgi:hypothetical protein